MYTYIYTYIYTHTHIYIQYTKAACLSVPDLSSLGEPGLVANL